jgi:ATP-dependent DNA helicase RecQ
LFEELRKLRSEIASGKNLPAYIVFGDATLRDMARRRPSALGGFLHIRGVGEQKCQQYGPAFLETLQKYCQSHSLAMDIEPAPAKKSIVQRKKESKPAALSASRELAFKLFRRNSLLKT